MRISGRHLTLVALASLVAGAVTAKAESADPRLPKPARAPIAPAPLPCTARPAPPVPAVAPAPPSDLLLSTFGVLRRDRTAQDELSGEALRALRGRGVIPYAPAVRLLRTTPEGGKAWIVPVARVGVEDGPLPCAKVAPVPTLVPRPAPRRRSSGRPVPAPVPAPLPPVPAGGSEVGEGVVVVATGGAPAGGGGPRAALVRGLGQITVDPCAGPQRTMEAISGVLPDGVDQAFLTRSDGTAVRTAVKDNGWAFVVPRPKRRDERRYVVWTGGDGTPHVQPVVSAIAGTKPCPGLAGASLPPVMTPSAWAACAPTLVSPGPPRPARPGDLPCSVVLPTPPRPRPLKRP